MAKIAAQQSVEIRYAEIPVDTSRGRLYYEMLVPLGGALLSELMPQLLRGERPAQPQDDAYATYEPPRPWSLPVSVPA